MSDNILSKDKPCEIELPDANAVLRLSYRPKTGDRVDKRLGGQSLEDRLVKVLLSVPGVNQKGSDNRDFLLDGLPKDAVYALKRDDHPRTDLKMIVPDVRGWGTLQNGELAVVVLIRNALDRARRIQPGRELERILSEFQIGFKDRLLLKEAEKEA